MQIPQRAFPENAVASKSQIQRKLEHPWFIDGAIHASNSYIAVRVPVEDSEDDHPGPIPVDAIKATRRNKTSLRLRDGEAEVFGYATFQRGSEMPPRNIQTIIEEHLSRPERIAVGLNTTLLGQAAKALGAKWGLRVTITAPDKPVILEPLPGAGGVPGAAGLIMPIRLTGESARPAIAFADEAHALLLKHGWAKNTLGKYSKGKRSGFSLAGAVKAELG